MPDKTSAVKPESVTSEIKPPRQPQVQPSSNSLLDLQRDFGNQAMLRLLTSGMLHAKLRVSRPGDADEQEADRVAEQIVSRRSAPKVQRKCACSGGTPCATCAAHQEDDVLHRSTSRSTLHSFPFSLQRAVADPSTPAAAPATTIGRRTGPLIVDDDAESLAPGQMKKSAFFDLLQAEVCATADAELAAVGRSSQSCPYIAKWLAFYRDQGSGHIEQALLKFAPEAAGATSARDYIVQLRVRVQKAVAIWVRTGEITGVPPGVGPMPAAAASDMSPGMGVPAQGNPAGQAVQFKEFEGASAPATDAAGVRAQLGHGRSLDPAVQGRMGAAFGHDFSSVRVHDDSSASGLSSQLHARAFTLGNDVAFAAGEYQPGTLIGDALIAHELAHVVQQGGASASPAPMKKSDAEYNSLEADADTAAAGAVLSSWIGRRDSQFAEIAKGASTRLKSGLRLQRCNDSSSKAPPAPTGSGSATPPPPPPPAHPSADGSKVTTAFGEFEAVKYHALVQKSTDKEVGVEMYLKFNPGANVDAKQIALSQAATGKAAGTPATTAGTMYARRSATVGSGQGYFIDRIAGFPNPLYPTGKTPTAGADATKLTSYPTVASTALTPAQVTSQEASTGVSGRTRDGWGKHGFRYMDGATLRGPESAELYDAPQMGTDNNSEQIFESTALAVEGTQKDTYYGSVNWGWKRDNAGTYSMLPLKVISRGTPSVNFLTAAGVWNTATADYNWGVTAATADLLDPADLTRTAATLTRGTALTWGGQHANVGGVEYRVVRAKDGPSVGTLGVIRAANMAMMDVGPATVHLPVPEVYTTNAASSPLVGNPAREGSTLIKNLPKDTRVILTDATTNPQWSKIKIVDGPDTNTEGWVKKTLLTREALGTHP